MAEGDWKQFHNPKDLAIAISLEASELLEHFLWKNGEEIGARVASHGQRIRDESADIGIYLMELCDVLGVDLAKPPEGDLARPPGGGPARQRGHPGVLAPNELQASGLHGALARYEERGPAGHRRAEAVG
jgi:NTP pyrophosphatase (non-canonical NTP hydrolase)